MLSLLLTQDVINLNDLYDDILQLNSFPMLSILANLIVMNSFFIWFNYSKNKLKFIIEPKTNNKILELGQNKRK